MTETAALPAWQRGHDLERLRAVADVFRETDKGHVLGAFTGFKERDVAEALAGGQLRTFKVGDEIVAALVWRRVTQRQGIKDFTGHVRARMEPGDVVVSRLAARVGYERRARSLLGAVAMDVREGEAMFVSTWQESSIHRAILAGLPAELVAVKIPASSELLGVYAMSKGERTVEHEPLPVEETWGLRRLALELYGPVMMRAVNELSRVDGWADHYSSYNKGHAWSALSLRGYSDDPAFIIKPGEMSKGWKSGNAAMMQASVRDTPLRAALPGLEPLIACVPGAHQRIRLMRLQPGGGELTRHADITDLEAGTGERKILRVHLPLATNPDVKFSSWTLDGSRYEENMRVGEAWYLDTRKPHTAINGGQTERVHLVIDAYSSPALLRALREGARA